MSDTEHVVKIKVDVGLTKEESEAFLSDLIMVGMENRGEQYIKEKYPNLKFSSVNIVREE